MTATIPRMAGVTLTLCALSALSIFSSAERTTSPNPVPDKFIGAKKCKSCHSDEESGDPYGAWSAAKHSKAFETLEGAAAKEMAAKLGISNPAESDACLECHVTGHGQPEGEFARGFKPELGVQCETCHGPGEDHMKARMKAAFSGPTGEGYQGSSVDEVIVTPPVDVCVQCHNPRSPSYQPFCYYEARGKIAHLDPRKPRTEEELESFGTCPHGDPCPHAEGCPEGTCNLKPDELAELAAEAEKARKQ